MRNIKAIIKGIVFVVVLTAGTVSCTYKAGPAPSSQNEQPAQQTPSQEGLEQQALSQHAPADQAATANSSDDDDGYTFATVPMPKKGNLPRFVSNPDGVLSEDAENELNRMLLYTKVELGIESCVIVVNHVANANVDSFAFALFNNFEHNENMIVIVLAYQDHGVRMEIGHELERRLSQTDCQSLLDNVLIPYLKEDNPDDGMIKLLEAVYYKIADKNKKK